MSSNTSLKTVLSASVATIGDEVVCGTGRPGATVASKQ